MEERLVYTEKVGGSSPSSPTRDIRELAAHLGRWPRACAVWGDKRPIVKRFWASIWLLVTAALLGAPAHAWFTLAAGQGCGGQPHPVARNTLAISARWARLDAVEGRWRNGRVGHRP